MRPRVARWALVGVLLLAFGLRLYRLGADSLWYDETVSLHLAGKELPALVAHTAGDIHPPGYYLLLHGWLRLSGSGMVTSPEAADPPVAAVDFVAAFFSLFFGLLLVALAYRLAAEVFGPPAGLLAAFLVAISPYNVWYSQEVRMYTLGAALGTGLLYAVLRLLRQWPAAQRQRQPGANPWPWLGLYILLGALGLWVLYYSAFLLVAINLMVGVWWLARRPRSKAWLGRWMLAQGAVLLLHSPWIPVAWRQATHPPVPPWRSFTGLGEVLLETWTALSLGQSALPSSGWPPVWVWLVLLLAAGLCLLSLFARRRQGRRLGAEPSFLAGHVLLPVLLIYLASMVTPLYHVRYAFPYSTPFYVLLAGGLAWLWQRRGPAAQRLVAQRLVAQLGWAWAGLAWLSLVAIVLSSAASLIAYHTDPHYVADDHRAAAAFLAERWRPGDAILVNAGYAYPGLLHYWEGEPFAWRGRLVAEGSADFAAPAGQGPILVQAGTVDGPSSLGWGDPASDFYAMSREGAAQALGRLFDTYHRVWVYRIYDTVTDPDGFVRDWLAEHGIAFEDQTFSGESQLRVQGFLTGRDPLSGTTVDYDAGLADGSLELLASDLGGSGPSAASVPVGGDLDLALVWRVGEESPEDAVLFAGLFDSAGQRWGQVDERPLGSLYPVGDWPAGAMIRTPVRLHVPPGTPPGVYRLEVGWYRFEEAQPVWLPWRSGERLLLGDVQVLTPAAGWGGQPAPAMAYTADVALGEGVRLLGFDAPTFSAEPGGSLRLDLYWLATADQPPPGAAVLQLSGPEGAVVAEVTGAPAGGLAPFAGLAAGQVVRDPRQILLPVGLSPGVYDLNVGRRGAEGTWLPVRRGLFSLGQAYPLASVHVLGREPNLTPVLPEHDVEGRFGEAIRLVGYDRGPQVVEPGSGLYYTLHWQALAPMSTRCKIFAHLVGEGGPTDIRAQADIYPHLPTTSWMAGEVLRDRLVLDLPPDLSMGRYSLLLGWYEEASGRRLRAFGPDGQELGDTLELDRLIVEE
jgi:hypothetical protein